MELFSNLAWICRWESEDSRSCRRLDWKPLNGRLDQGPAELLLLPESRTPARPLAARPRPACSQPQRVLGVYRRPRQPRQRRQRRQPPRPRRIGQGGVARAHLRQPAQPAPGRGSTPIKCAAKPAKPAKLAKPAKPPVQDGPRGSPTAISSPASSDVVPVSRENKPKMKMNRQRTGDNIDPPSQKRPAACRSPCTG
jgi:hypothetical protein